MNRTGKEKTKQLLGNFKIDLTLLMLPFLVMTVSLATVLVVGAINRTPPMPLKYYVYRDKAMTERNLEEAKVRGRLLLYIGNDLPVKIARPSFSLDADYNILAARQNIDVSQLRPDPGSNVYQAVLKGFVRGIAWARTDLSGKIPQDAAKFDFFATAYRSGNGMRCTLTNATLVNITVLEEIPASDEPYIVVADVNDFRGDTISRLRSSWLKRGLSADRVILIDPAGALTPGSSLMKEIKGIFIK